ncbi:acyl-CoA delta-11 desaturase isoform X1 [Bombyx mori]|uniref:Acyl-CoA delta-11 desaturase isoform 1 n=2 Tax=Bombyx mori TaxID=7091 RepID=Q2F669_BOMMO|nr:acyl-CoA delta-11 desaturase isoform 1 [Bombyx mori]XP_012553085.2 acyl-CoA delta-11 desaturase isoform X1 [Bombyx mori]XP_012553086.2 acyl-CoA delta-11 desaturase isoform X1 [Bombyx mori]XP_021209229.2 acyl-CoA delta-11 desaturase isoform X1 [Bombyx mori]XP_021209230.2 acyl-CoA delta-11 desaturase isoform X1 [Bombyx mori]XP_037876125.1 acyl-CoA delta-11 desaturase isoform X1 [Bombyx mori]ABD36148.1 acyl-CoA delta-11 desaturase isoform 1 [Bombyx mori]
MAQNQTYNGLIVTEIEDSSLEHDSVKPSVVGPREYEIVYKNIFIHIYLHVTMFYGLYLCCTTAKWPSVGFAYLCYVAATIGVTAGAHRLWSHKSYKARLPLQILLMVFLSLANQRATHWVRDHRVHHKYSDTDADPHNASRGFFYSHIGWLFVRKHPEVKKKGKLIDLSDLFDNPALMFQHRYSKTFIPIVCFGLPTILPVILWDELLVVAWNLTIMRYVINFHVFFLVNSVAHIWGNKPYDKTIKSAENNLVAFATLGEGYHNYHHVFPWDYRCTELGRTWLNYTKLFIDLCAKVGLAYDLKVVSDDVILRRVKRTGDRSHFIEN